MPKKQVSDLITDRLFFPRMLQTPEPPSGNNNRTAFAGAAELQESQKHRILSNFMKPEGR